jgi:hypothetical protein
VSGLRLVIDVRRLQFGQNGLSSVALVTILVRPKVDRHERNGVGLHLQAGECRRALSGNGVKHKPYSLDVTIPPSVAVFILILSKRPRRSKNGTPEERAALAAAEAAGATIRAMAAGTLAPALSQEELRALYDRLSPEQQTIAAGLIRKLVAHD